MAARRIRMLSVSIVASCVAGAAAVHAFAADLPVLKPGLWEVTRVATQRGGKTRLVTMCLDDSVQAEMREYSMGVAREMCQQNDRTIEGNRMTTTSTCAFGLTTMKKTSVMVVSGNTSYHTDATATYDPPYMNMAKAKSTIDGKWTGPCKAGQVPGDIVNEDGKTINIKTMMKK